ncbi:MAG: ABC transporter permease [Kiritimatiellia bacterium]|nr:ABC transporter permease subunit [Lentisphaerota bacterium]
MNACWTVFQRQLLALLRAPATYVISVTFLLVTGFSFCRLTSQTMEERLLPGDLLFGSVFFWLAAIIAMALITMSAFTEEKKSGTLEMLLTAPVTDTQVVMAKYFAALIVFLLICLPTTLYIPLLELVGGWRLMIEPAVLAGGYTALLLIGAAGLACGVCASALTRNQAAAACICFTIVSLFFFVDVFRLLLPPEAALFIEVISPAQHIMDFTQGIFDTRPVIFYISSSVFFLFATVKLLEARHWQ